MTYYISGESVYNASNWYVAVYIDVGGYPEGQYGNRPIYNDGDKGDPFWAMGYDSDSKTQGVKQVEIGFLDDYRIKIGDEGGTESIWGWDESTLTWIDLIAGGGVAHNRLHEMTNVLDHNSSTTWKMWYADGAGPPAAVQNVALGLIGKMLVAQGVAAAPIFTKTLGGCVSEATAFIVTDGVVEVKIWCDGTDTHIKSDGGDIILDPAGGDVTLPGASKIWDACWN